MIGALAIGGWARSCWRVDQWRYQGWLRDGDFGRYWLRSDRGGIYGGYAHFAKSFYLSPAAGVADYPNGFVWQSWEPPVSDVEADVYQRLGVKWSSDDLPGAYRTWVLQLPYWLIALLASILPVRWVLVRRANRRRGFDVEPATTPSPSTA